VIRWFHRLFSPHCEKCQNEVRESQICNTCEELKSILSIEKHEKKQLLETLLNYNKFPVEVNKEEPEVIRPNFRSWKIRQQILEQEDLKAKQVLIDLENEKLERELGIKQEQKHG
jgi:hypothetical protein